jgi:hypothetical protein
MTFFGTLAMPRLGRRQRVSNAFVGVHTILRDFIMYLEVCLFIVNIGKLYGERPPIEDFFEWRDLRVMDEVHWYG